MKTARMFYSGLCATALLAGVALLAPPQSASAQTLVHRYSMDDDGTGTNLVDSAGGTNGYGWIMNPGGGEFSVSPGQLTLDASAGDYGQFPVGILSNYTSVTMDIWVSLTTSSYVWAFGNTDTNGDANNGDGGNALWLHGGASRLTLSDTTPSWASEQNAYFAPLNGIGMTHVTCVVDPPNSRMLVYTNGVLAGQRLASLWALSNVTNLYNYLGKSVYNADGLSSMTVDEFRIWNGVAGSLTVAGWDVTGPDVLGTAANIGTITNLMLSAPQLQTVQGGRETVSVTAYSTFFTNSDYSPKVLTIDNTLCTFKSSNTNVLTVTTNGLVLASLQNIGTASIIASYGGATSSVAITVIPTSSQMTHRYSFVDDGTGTNVTDSVGGAAWNGWVVNNSADDFGVGAGGLPQLTLNSNESEYVQFPVGIISNYTTITVDMWASFPDPLPANCFLWCFGRTDGGGAGGNAIFFQPKNGRVAISGGDPTWAAGEDNAYGSGDLSGTTNMHITSVINGLAGWEAVYVNGKLVGKNTALTFGLTQVSNINNYIAKSLYNGDQSMDLVVNEYRIFNGPLTSQEIELADAAGPTSVPATVTNGPGNLLGFNVKAPSTLQMLQYAPVSVTANYQYLTNFDLVGQNVFAPVGMSISVGNTNILSFNSTSGRVQGVGVGTSYLVVSYLGVNTTNNITVSATVPANQVATLVHRYSFHDTVGSTTAADSVGGSAWNATLPNGGTFSGTNLFLSGTTTQYVNLPFGVLSTSLTAVSIDAWATFAPSLPGAACFFSFGWTDSGGAGADYLFCSPQGGRWDISGTDPGWQSEENAYSGMDWSGKSMHFTGVVNPAANYIAIYTNGVLAGAGYETHPLSAVTATATNCNINLSTYTGDPHLNLTINEFRIYSGVLNPSDVAAIQAAGPNALPGPKLSVAVSAGSLVVSWPGNVTGLTLKSTTNLKGGTWSAVGTSPVLSGGNYQVTLPLSGTAQFFRLSQ